MRKDELCGVIVYSYPPPACYGRRIVLPRMTMKEINQQLSTINRVVIHPKYRTIGLGAKLIRETLPRVGTPNVELIAVMAKYSSFAEKAGMQKIAEQQSIENVSKISKALIKLEFDLQLLGSQRYVLRKLEALTADQLLKLKETFLRNTHPRFKREFAVSRHQPFGKTSDYYKSVQEADLPKIAKLLKIVGILLQTKVYLFWKEIKLNILNTKVAGSNPSGVVDEQIEIEQCAENSRIYPGDFAKGGNVVIATCLPKCSC